MENDNSIKGNDARDLDKELDNFLNDNYPKIETDDTYESSKINYRYPRLVRF